MGAAGVVGGERSNRLAGRRSAGGRRVQPLDPASLARLKYKSEAALFFLEIMFGPIPVSIG